MKEFVWAFCCAKESGKGSTVTFEGDLVKEPSGMRMIDFWTEALALFFSLPSEALNVGCQEAGGTIVVPITGPLPPAHSSRPAQEASISLQGILRI